MDDRELLDQFVKDLSQSAFRELVERHLPVVYSAARRIVRDCQLAEEVAQTVFTMLARKAESIRPPQIVGGWLYNTTRHLAMHSVRSEQRRRERESEYIGSCTMQSLAQPSDDSGIAEHLEPAMSELDAEDRDALVLRYLGNRAWREVGLELGISEEAARKRGTRAVERLRALLEKRSVAVTTVLLATALTESTVAVPVGLCAAIATTALAGIAVQSSVVITAGKAISMTTLQKTLFGAALVAAIGVGIYEARQTAILKSQVQTLRAQRSPFAEVDQLRSENERLAGRLQASAAELESLRIEREELLRLRGQVGTLRSELAETKQRLSDPAGQTNDLAKTWAVGEVKGKEDWQDAGLRSPLAAIETFWWAAANNNAERMKQCLVFDRRPNAEPVPDQYAKREVAFYSATLNSKAYEFAGVRLLAHGFDANDSERATIEIAVMRHFAKPDGDGMDQQGLQLRRVNDEWKIIRSETSTKLTLLDEDSEAVAKMMLLMDPKTLEQAKASGRIPIGTLKAYERLKANGSQ